MTVTSLNQTEPTTKVREEPPRANRPIYLRRMNRPLDTPPFGNEPPPAERPKAESTPDPDHAAGLNTRTGNRVSIAGMVFVATVIVGELVRLWMSGGIRPHL